MELYAACPGCLPEQWESFDEHTSIVPLGYWDSTVKKGHGIALLVHVVDDYTALVAFADTGETALCAHPCNGLDKKMVVCMGTCDANTARHILAFALKIRTIQVMSK